MSPSLRVLVDGYVVVTLWAACEELRRKHTGQWVEGPRRGFITVTSYGHDFVYEVRLSCDRSSHDLELVRVDNPDLIQPSKQRLSVENIKRR